MTRGRRIMAGGHGPSWGKALGLVLGLALVAGPRNGFGQGTGAPPAGNDVVEGIVDGPPELPEDPGPAPTAAVAAKDAAGAASGGAVEAEADGEAGSGSGGDPRGSSRTATSGAAAADVAAGKGKDAADAASLEADILGSPDDQFDIAQFGGPYTPWKSKWYHAIGLVQVLMDRSDTEVTAGIEFSGFDPFDEDRSDTLDPQTSTKWSGRYRVGLSSHNYTAPGRLPGTFVASELTLLTLAFGWDYAFRRQARSPFVSAYLLGVVPSRSQPLPARDDRVRTGIGLGGGQVTHSTLARVEYQFLEGDTDILMAGFGWRF